MKKENELCSLKENNCGIGLTCTNEKDGCDNDVGKCRKGNQTNNNKFIRLDKFTNALQFNVVFYISILCYFSYDV